MDIGGGGIIGGGGSVPDFLQPSAQIGPSTTTTLSAPITSAPAASSDYPGFGGYGAVGGSWVPESPTFTAAPVAPNQVLYAHYASPQAAVSAAALTPAAPAPIASQAMPSAAPAIKPVERRKPAAKPIDKPIDKPADKPSARTITVKSGDSLTKIAAAAGVDWKQLYNLNKGVVGGDPNLIRAGQQLKLP